MSIHCQVCGQNSWTAFGRVLNRCQNCSFVRAKDKYFKTNENKLYTQSYYNGADYVSYEGEERALRKNFQDRLARILKYKRKGKLLEIGCAYGYFLSTAKKHFECSGIELDKDIAANAHKQTGCRVYSGDFLKMNLKKNSFDVICMFDTIEHLKYPRLYLEKIYGLLKNEGVVVIETGDIDAMLPKIQRDSWRLITPPYHLSYFGKRTISRLLKDIGFTQKELVCVPFYRTLGQTMYRINRNLILKSTRLTSIVFPVNVFDLIFGVWKKVDDNSV